MSTPFKVRAGFLILCAIALLLALSLHTLYKSNLASKSTHSPKTSTPTETLALNFDALSNAINQNSPSKNNTDKNAHHQSESSIPSGAIPNQRILRFATDEELEKFRTIAERYGLKILGSITQFRAIRVEFENLYQFGNVLEQSPDPLAIDYNFKISVPPFKTPDGRQFNPNDYTSFHNTLADWLGINPSQLPPSTAVTIAIMDTAIQPHNALPKDRIIHASTPGIAPSNNPPTAAAGHGTAVASIIIGQHPLVQGIAPGVRILNVPVLGNDGYGDSFTLAQGILTALQTNPQIINLSLSSAGDSPVLREAIAAAVKRNVFIVAASGNQGQDTLAYPAAYPGVISVGAVDASSQHLPFSNAGNNLTVTAPGWGINTAWEQEKLVRFSGTSAAAPVVSAAIAHLISKFPSLTPSTLIQMLQTYSDDAGAPGYDPYYGNGIINIQRLLTQDIPNIRNVAMVSHHIPDTTGDMIPLQISVQNRGTQPENNIYVDLSLPWSTLQRLQYPMLNVGQTGTQTIMIPRQELLNRRQVDITSTVHMPQWNGGPKQFLQTTITLDK
jgi:hypothetical protein